MQHSLASWPTADCARRSRGSGEGIWGCHGNRQAVRAGSLASSGEEAEEPSAQTRPCVTSSLRRLSSREEKASATASKKSGQRTHTLVLARNNKKRWKEIVVREGVHFS